MKKILLKTENRDECVDITKEIENIIGVKRISDGVCHIYVPSTTAGIMINEGHDREVVHDLLVHLDKTVPWNADYYGHQEGNSAAHIKSSLIGTSICVIVDHGKLMLGKWQEIFFCEFDGPREREIYVKFIR